MHRFNIFSYFHNGLKALLHDINLNIRETDFSDPADAAAVLKSLTEAVHLFKDHNQRENNHILPLVFEYEPSVWDTFQQEYRRDGLLLQNLESAINTYHLMDTPFDRSFAGNRLQQSYVEFVTFTIEHMTREEELLNQTLRRYYSDDVLFAIQHQILSHTDAREAVLYHQWYLKSTRPDVYETVEAIAPEKELPAVMALYGNENSPRMAFTQNSFFPAI